MPKFKKPEVRNITEVQISSVESHYNGKFTLTLEGKTPRGRQIKVGATIAFDEFPYIHDNMTVAYKRHRESLLRSMTNMDAAFNWKP